MRAREAAKIASKTKNTGERVLKKPVSAWKDFLGG